MEMKNDIPKRNGLLSSINSTTTSIFQNTTFNRPNVTQSKGRCQSSFLSNALSQSLAMEKTFTNCNTQIVNNNDTLIAEKNKLQDEVYTIKGQLALIHENQSQNILNRDKKIKLLQEELNKVKVESKRFIESLESQLEFNNATLIAANQKNLDSFSDQDLSFCQDCASPKTKRIKLNKVFPTIKRNIFINDNSFISGNNTTKAEISSIPLDQSRCDDKTDVEDMVVNHEEFKPLVVEVKTTTESIIKSITIVKTSQQSKPLIRTLLQFPDKDSFLDILYIVDQINQPINCCTTLDFDNDFHRLILLTNKLTKIVFEDNNMELKEVSITSSERKKNVKEVKYLVKSPVELLVKSMDCRSGGLNYNNIKRTIYNIVSEKNKFLVNPQYYCCYKQIYPVWETVKKLMYLESKYSSIGPEIFAEIVVPSFMSIINKFCYTFCCQTVEIEYDCVSYKNNTEMDFIRFILESFIKTLEFATEAQAIIIYQELFKSFINLVPLFATKIDLRITVLKLFTKMCIYGLSNNFSAVIYNDKKDGCLLCIIFDLLKCECLERQGDEAAHFLNQVIDFSKVMCDGNFNWKSDCKCMDKLFSLLLYLGQIVTLHVVKGNYNVKYVDSIKGLLEIFVQFLNTLGPELSSNLNVNSAYKPFLITIEYLPSMENFTNSSVQLIIRYLKVLVNLVDN